MGKRVFGGRGGGIDVSVTDAYGCGEGGGDDREIGNGDAGENLTLASFDAGG